jgi:hypothetical protein
MVLAATVVVQGAVLSSVEASGPLLPPAVETKIPADAADRKASWIGESSPDSKALPTE